MVTKDFEPTTSKKTKESKLNHNNKNSTSNNAAAVSLVNDLEFRYDTIR